MPFAMVNKKKGPPITSRKIVRRITKDELPK